MILANPVMIDAYRAGTPGIPAATVPGTLDNVDFMERDSKRFADTGGWGWAVFDYTTASDT